MPKVERESAAPPKPRPLGPNLKRLIGHKMAMDAIPDGGGFAEGVKFLATPGAMAAGWRDATEWVDSAILAIRQAGEPNPWKNSSEEEIAGELLRKIKARKLEVGNAG
jgi:hypothetical protein